jgi:hypothetical protein
MQKFKVDLNIFLRCQCYSLEKSLVYLFFLLLASRKMGAKKERGCKEDE